MIAAVPTRWAYERDEWMVGKTMNILENTLVPCACQSINWLIIELTSILWLWTSLVFSIFHTEGRWSYFRRGKAKDLDNSRAGEWEVRILINHHQCAPWFQLAPILALSTITTFLSIWNSINQLGLCGSSWHACYTPGDENNNEYQYQQLIDWQFPWNDKDDSHWMQ